MPNGRGGDFSSFEADPRKIAEELRLKRKLNGGGDWPDPEPLIEPRARRIGSAAIVKQRKTGRAAAAHARQTSTR